MSWHRLMWVIEIRKFMVALGGVHPEMFGLCLNETHFLWPLKWVYIVSKKIANLLCQIDDEEEREGAKHYLASTWRMNPSPCVDKTHIPHKIAFPCIAPLGFDPRTFGLWAQHASSAPRSTYFQSGNVKFKYCYVFIVLPEDLSMKVGSNADLIKSLATRHSGRWFLDGVEWKCQIVVWYGNMTILLRTYVTLPLTYHMIVSSFEAPT